MAKEILCGFGIDVDAVAGWLGSYGGEDSPDDISRGLFAGEVGSPAAAEAVRAASASRRPGSSPATRSRPSPSRCRRLPRPATRSAFMAISHENPIAMTREQETAVLDKCIDLVTKLSGKRPTGYVAPWWEFSTRHQRAAARARHQIRPLADARRLPRPITCASATAGPRSTIRRIRQTG